MDDLLAYNQAILLMQSVLVGLVFVHLFKGRWFL